MRAQVIVNMAYSEDDVINDCYHETHTAVIAHLDPEKLPVQDMVCLPQTQDCWSRKLPVKSSRQTMVKTSL